MGEGDSRRAELIERRCANADEVAQWMREVYEMSEKKKDPVIKDYEKLKNEVVIDKVNEIFRTQPDNYIAALEEIGFEYHEEDDYEEIEERNARPENQNQKDLVAFFKGEKKLFDPDYARFLLCLALKRKTDIVITQFKA